MTLENIVICNGCGERVNPPRNSNWLVLFVIGPDGVNVSDTDGHLCVDCRREFRQWREARLKSSEASRQRPS